jgi:carbon storage regulator
MFMVSRKVGEAVVIADNIRVTVMAIHGDKVRMGIAAPRDVSVDRLEIHGLKKTQRKSKQQQVPLDDNLQRPRRIRVMHADRVARKIEIG